MTLEIGERSDHLKIRARHMLPVLHSGLKRSGGASAARRVDVSTLWLSSCASRGKQLSLFPPTAQFGFVHVCFPNCFSSGGTIYIPLKVFTFHLLPMTYYFCVPQKLLLNVQGK